MALGIEIVVLGPERTTQALLEFLVPDDDAHRTMGI
jgi:hypothetical protein